MKGCLLERFVPGFCARDMVIEICKSSLCVLGSLGAAHRLFIIFVIVPQNIKPLLNDRYDLKPRVNLRDSAKLQYFVWNKKWAFSEKIIIM